MLRYAIIFIIIALVAGFLGFGSLEGLAPPSPRCVSFCS